MHILTTLEFTLIALTFHYFHKKKLHFQWHWKLDIHMCFTGNVHDFTLQIMVHGTLTIPHLSHE